jgi:hypothetical protein
MPLARLARTSRRSAAGFELRKEPLLLFEQPFEALDQRAQGGQAATHRRVAAGC